MIKRNIIILAIFFTIAGCSKDNYNNSSMSAVQQQTKGPITLSISKVTVTTVCFTASLDVDMMADYQEVGFIYSTDDNMDVENPAVTIVKINKESYSETFTGLSSDTDYYYTVYLLRNNVYSYGETMSFTTLSFLDQSDFMHLSSSASANCYIVSNSGRYKFETVKGNSGESVGSVSSAVVLWETFGTSVTPKVGDLIESVYYEDGYIAFHTADTFKEGNAVIAAKDASGNILWSWHIWLTDQPQAQVYNNNAGTMMDRNLGATSAIPGEVCALGLLYQWGRKDPFLGSSYINSSTTAKSTITWPSTESSNSSRGTISYATAHPTTFITYNNDNGDWFYTGSSSTDNTRWTTSESTKSIYDPCPAGWRVPDGGSNGVWPKAGFDDTTYDSTNEGISFSISSPSTTWYPASGYRYSVGGLDYVGYNGFYWSASPSSNSAYRLYFINGGGVNPSSSSRRASGFSVRCLQESK